MEIVRIMSQMYFNVPNIYINVKKNFNRFFYPGSQGYKN